MVHMEATYEPGQTEIKTIATYNYSPVQPKSQAFKHVPDDDSDLFAPPKNKNNFGPKISRLPLELEQEYIAAKEFLDNLVVDYTLEPLQAASVYFETYPHIQPYPLRPCHAEEQRAAWRMFNKKEMPMTRLFGSLDRPHLYTLHTSHLGLPPEYGDPQSYFYDRALIDGWKSRLKEKLSGTYFWRLEVASRIHVHLIAAHDAGLLDLPRTGEVVKPVKPGTELKLVTYLCKPRATCSVPNLGQWIHAKREYQGYLPHMQGHVDLIPARRFFAN